MQHISGTCQVWERVTLCQLQGSAEQLAGRTCCIARRSLLPESNRNLSKTCAIVPLDMTGMVEVGLRRF